MIIQLPAIPPVRSTDLLCPVAVLCTAPNSIYKTLPGVVVYDKERDCRTFPGGMSVVCHAPCRPWSAYCAHQAKPQPGEKELGLFCADMLRKWGGVLEHPAHSRLFEASNLPKPGDAHGDLWTMEVWQAWWGYPMRKATWLCFCGISPAGIEVPFRLHPRGGDRRTEQLMSKQQRSVTTLEFATWLVEVARRAGHNEESERWRRPRTRDIERPARPPPFAPLNSSDQRGWP